MIGSTFAGSASRVIVACHHMREPTNCDPGKLVHIRKSVNLSLIESVPRIADSKNRPPHTNHHRQGCGRGRSTFGHCAESRCWWNARSTAMRAIALVTLLLQLRAQPAHAEAGTHNATVWLGLARDGFCGLTDAGEEGDCQFGDSGSFGRVVSSTWTTAADSCLER